MPNKNASSAHLSRQVQPKTTSRRGICIVLSSTDGESWSPIMGLRSVSGLPTNISCAVGPQDIVGDVFHVIGVHGGSNGEESWLDYMIDGDFVSNLPLLQTAPTGGRAISAPEWTKEFDQVRAWKVEKDGFRLMSLVKMTSKDDDILISTVKQQSRAHQFYAVARFSYPTVE